MAIAFPFANGLLIYPAFERILVSGVEEDASHLTRHMLPELFSVEEVSGRTTLSLEELASLERLGTDFKITKLKVFNEDGVVLFSSDSADFGTRNEHDYFLDVVAQGRPFSKLVTEGEYSQEGVEQVRDVVETYVPFMSDGRFMGALEIYFDVSNRKHQLDRLAFWSLFAMIVMSLALVAVVYLLLSREKGYSRLLEQNRNLREDVDRIVQHDLKSPLSTMLAGIGFLQSGPPAEDRDQMLAELHNLGWRMMRMVNSSLDLYKMEVGTYLPTAEPVDLLGVGRDVAAELASLAEGRQVSLKLDFAGEGSGSRVVVSGEETLCHALMANLVKNALEACEPGQTVTLTVNREGQWGVIRVVNPGCIPEAIRPIFFEKYATSGKPDGTGLGTYSARLSAEAQSGTIEIDDTGGRVTVTVRLPIRGDGT